MKLLFLIVKNVGRSPLRSTLTALGVMVLVLVVTLVWSALSFLDGLTREKTKNLKAIVTERWRIPSQMPYTYVPKLAEGAARYPGDVKPQDWMAWQFYGGTLDPTKQTRNNVLFAVAMDPSKVRTMMDELDQLAPGDSAELDEAIRRMQNQRNGMILGRQRLKAVEKHLGDRMTVHSLNYKGINLEFEIVGTFPAGRYDNSAVMNAAYLNEALDAYPRKSGGRAHPMAQRSLNLVWLRVPDMEAFSRVAGQIISSPYFANPAVKCETASSGIAAFLDAFRDILWGMRWLFSPAALVTLSLVIANAISISVRERRMELAVLKVLGFRPVQVMLLVLGEALLLGTTAGFASTSLAYLVANRWMGGVPLGMFGSLYIPADALWWGPAIGAAAALAGSIAPALAARNVKVAEVFSHVA